MIGISTEPTVVLDCRIELGESILWDDRTRTLWFVNIQQGQLWSFTPENGAVRILELRERVGAVALRRQGGIVAALESRFAIVDDRDGRLSTVADIKHTHASIRLNDGRVDPAGRFVCGGLDEAEPQQAIARVYSLDAGAGVRQLLDGVSCSNSICWSPDGRTFYFTDMPQARIDAWDYDVANGKIANRRLFADLANEPGLADGSITDADGYLWNAQWGGSKLVRYAPNGSVDREIPLPVSNPTCLAFGGPDLDILFVTSARFSLSGAQLARQPHAGSLLALQPGVRGRPEHRFSG